MISSVRALTVQPSLPLFLLEDAPLIQHVGRGALAFLISSALSVGLFSAAAQPVSDRFEQRSLLSGTNLSLIASNVGATVDPEESLRWDLYRQESIVWWVAPTWNRLESTVWWSWVAPAKGYLVVNIGTDDYPARFAAVFTGNAVDELQAPELEFAPGTDEGQPFAPGFLGVSVEPGVTYQWVVSGMNGETGEFPLRLLFLPAPSNDDFSSAEALDGLEWTIEYFNTLATRELYEPSYEPGPLSRTLWWSWTSPTRGVFSACLDPSPLVGEDLTPGYAREPLYELAVFTGDILATLQPIASARQYAGLEDDPPAAWLSFTAEAGVTYHFRTGATVSPQTKLTQRLIATARPEVMITNPLKGQDWRAGDAVAIMAEARDPDGQIAQVEFGTDGVADVTWPYTRVLTNVSPGLHSISVRAIDDRGAASDSVEATFTVRPWNDHFAERQALTVAPLELTNTFAGASLESFESASTGGSDGSEGSLWWTWTASSSGPHTITAAGLSSLAVYRGEQPNQLEVLAADPDEAGGDTGSGRRKVVITAEAGQVYQLQAIGAALSAAEQHVLSILRGVPPEVELTAPTAHWPVFRGQPLELTARADDVDGTITEVAFYVNGEWVGSINQPPFTYSLVVTQSNSVELEAWAWDDSGLQARSATVWVPVFAPPPPNDAFADRIPLEGAPVTFAAELQSATPDDFGQPGSPSAWWSWTPAVTGPHAIRVVQPGGLPGEFGVYRGAVLDELVPVVTSSSTFAAVPGVPGHIGFHAESGVVYAIALYAAGPGSTTAEIIATAPPAVAIVYPPENALLSPGSIMLVEVEASEPEDRLARVDLYLGYGSRLIGSLEAPPFIWAVPLPQFDAYGRLHAVAVDQDGSVGVSDSRRFKVGAAPVNDAFADRLPFPDSGEIATVDLWNATLEEGEPDPLGITGTAWWTWEASSSGPFTLVVTSRNSWPGLSVFTGSSLSTLAGIGSDHSRYRGEGALARLTFAATSGTAYQFAVTGGATTSIRLVPSALPAARIVSPADNSAWVEGTPIPIRVEVEDPEEVIREVTLLSGWLPVATRRDPPFDFIYVPPVWANTRPERLRARLTDAAGLWSMPDWIELEVLARRSPNDDFADRLELSGAFVRMIPIAGVPSYESGEPRHAWSGFGSTWYSWRAPGTGLALVTLGPLASGVATSLRVFTGSRPTDLIEVAAYSAPPTGGSRGAYLAPLQAVFLARAGIQYQIQLTDYSYDRGDSDGSARLQLWFEHREISNLRRLADGALVLDFTTSGERDWLIEGSSELRQWLPLDIRRSADGRFRFTDPDAASHPSRFYRLSPLP